MQCMRMNNILDKDTMRRLDPIRFTSTRRTRLAMLNMENMDVIPIEDVVYDKMLQ